jgi:hypothetical protein
MKNKFKPVSRPKKQGGTLQKQDGRIIVWNS